VFGGIADKLMSYACSQTAMYASGAGLGASKGKDITKVAGLDYAALSKESVSDEWGSVQRRAFTDKLNAGQRKI